MIDDTQSKPSEPRSLLLVVQGMKCLMAFDSSGYFYSHQDLSSYLLGEHKKEELKRMASDLRVSRVMVTEKSALQEAFRGNAQSDKSLEKLLNTPEGESFFRIFEFKNQSSPLATWKDSQTNLSGGSVDSEPSLEAGVEANERKEEMQNAQKRYEELKNKYSGKSEGKSQSHLLKNFFTSFRKKKDDQDQSSF